MQSAETFKSSKSARRISFAKLYACDFTNLFSGKTSDLKSIENQSIVCIIKNSRSWSFFVSDFVPECKKHDL